MFISWRGGGVAEPRLTPGDGRADGVVPVAYSSTVDMSA
jgi:hypothetical protein